MAWHPHERAALADALQEAGPGVPTLCEGWRTEHLAAHVVLRERDMLTAAGIAVPALSARTARVTLARGDRAADPAGYARLVSAVREGPPRWSPLSWAGDAAQHLELFVHAEDVRRRPDSPGPPRVLAAAEDEALWHRLVRAAPRLYRCWLDTSALVLQAPGRTARLGDPEAAGTVTVSGGVGELVLHAFGRTGAAQVTVDGPPADVERMLADVRRV
ncbi:MAG: TIGR03085 family protein [Actinomycetales bacterium]|nr:TIGR03085 family protein [Actinomycetales bacterium]